MNLSLHKIKFRKGTPTSGTNGNRDFFDWLVPVLGRGLEPKPETMAYSVINRVSAGSRALANAACQKPADTTFLVSMRISLDQLALAHPLEVDHLLHPAVDHPHRRPEVRQQAGHFVRADIR